MEIKSYKKYKDINLSWLDKMPSHWNIDKNRLLWSERKEVNFSDKELISVTISSGVILQSELLKNTSKKDSSNLDKSKYKLIKNSDIVYNPMRMWQGAVGISEYEGIVSPAYVVLKSINNVNYKYYNYLLRTPDYIKESYRNSYGLCDDQLKLRYEDFRNMYNIIPPKEEQDQIVAFLDDKLKKIDKFIDLKARQIELLKEQKEAMINKAVTKGLDDNVAIKDSGVQWLGEIPDDWNLIKLKYCFSNVVNNTKKLNKNEIYIGLANIESWTGKVINLEEAIKFDSNSPKFKPGDVLFGKLRPYLAKATLSKNHGVCSGEILVLRDINGLISEEFLLYIMLTYSFIDIVDSSTYGAKMPRANWEFIGSLEIPLINKEEQKRIINYIKNQSKIIDENINLYQKEIELIKEYRTSLISSVVTGKIDIRECEEV